MQIIGWCQSGGESLFEPMLAYCWLDPWEIKIKQFSNKKMDFKMFPAKLHPFCLSLNVLNGLIRWGQVTYICVSKLTIIGSDNVLSPGWCQAIILTNAGILSIGPLEINFSENSIKIPNFSFMKMQRKISSGNWRPFCLALNGLSLTDYLNHSREIWSA